MIFREIHYTKIDTKSDRNLTHLNFHRIKQTKLPPKTTSPNHLPKVKSFSRVQLFVTPWTVACQAPLSMGFSRQEYWSGLPFPSPGDLSKPEIEPGSPAFQANSLPHEPGNLPKITSQSYHPKPPPKTTSQNHWDQMVPTDNFTKPSNTRQSQCFKNLLESLENQGLFLILFMKQV